MTLLRKILLAAAVIAASGLGSGAAVACEEEEAAAPCRLEQACDGRDAPLCRREARRFCAEKGHCTDAATLTMDPRRCVALNAKIRDARGARKKAGSVRAKAAGATRLNGGATAAPVRTP